MLLSLLVVPVLGLVADLSASRTPSAGEQHQSALRHRPPSRWRTAPAAIERPAPPLQGVPLAIIDVPEPGRTRVLLVRRLFVPPRG